ncbi:hypothetical protein Bequi_00770 [Brachybacterium sp. JHP9]|uniref:Uncharacterized protein n=1 Tax=Brachybacterium equifaecis TaxID=2910770 RepID=A0ABT0QYZ8_9MICO|nr:hypothetical protein [Brachybacterium equifaecis]MCL6421930.1 hypothetical protein [Brachybacterium equifaecis]
MPEQTDTPTPMTTQVLLDELDVYGLEPGRPGGFPADEYTPEAQSLADHLLADGRIDLAAVDEIWLRWFSETLTDVAGPERAAEFVEKLSALAPGNDAADPSAS